MKHKIRCSCGKLQGEVLQPELGVRAICYCQDCQAFASYLNKSNEVLDAAGGTEVVGLRPKNIVFTEGIEYLTCMSLSQKGLLRWFSKCCNTPIGNTPKNFKIAHVGLIHTCIDGAPSSLEGAFGRLDVRINTGSAKQKPAASKGMTKRILAQLASLLRERISGSYRQTPFFNRQTGEPVSQPVILDDEQRRQLNSAA